MKILMINVVCGIKSTGRICTDLAVALENRGHEVKIAYGREQVPEEFQKYAVRIGNDWDVKRHGIRARLWDGTGFGSKSATEALIAWIREFDPDMIHLHNIHGYYINVEVLFHYLATCGKKIIWTLHDCWAFTGHSPYCDAVQCEKWKTGCFSCPQLNRYPKSFLDRSKENWQKKKALFSGIPNVTLITPSQWLAGLVKQSFLSEYPVEVIHNGIDTEQFYPLENDFKKIHGVEDKFLLLGVANVWDDLKGLPDFIQLSGMLGEEYRIVLVGLSEEQQKGLPGNIIGIGRTSSVKELAQLYSACDVFLNLTYCDNYPTVNLEALACGTPVITYDTGGSAESVTDNAGAVVKQGDLQGVLETVVRFQKSGGKKPITGSSDLKFYDKSLALNNYLSIYRERSALAGERKKFLSCNNL